MNLTAQQIIQALQQGELQAFGISMPRLAPDWASGGASNPFKVSDATPADSSDPPIMTITATANWAAPFDAMFTDVATGQLLPVTLVQAGGNIESSPGALLTIPDQAWLRLGRLYCEILETSDPTRPERDLGRACRPVPRYVFFPTRPSPRVRSRGPRAWRRPERISAFPATPVSMTAMVCRSIRWR